MVQLVQSVNKSTLDYSVRKFHDKHEVELKAGTFCCTKKHLFLVLFSRTFRPGYHKAFDRQYHPNLERTDICNFRGQALRSSNTENFSQKSKISNLCLFSFQSM